MLRAQHAPPDHERLPVDLHRLRDMPLIQQHIPHIVRGCQGVWVLRAEVEIHAAPQPLALLPPPAAATGPRPGQDGS